MQKLANLIQAEPVRFMSAIQLTLVLAFLIWPVSSAVSAAVFAALAAWLGFFTRKQVVPISKPQA